MRRTESFFVIAVALSRCRKSAKRFSDKNLQQNKKPGGRLVGLPKKHPPETSARIEFDDEIRFHLHGIGDVVKARHPAELGRELSLVDLDIVGDITLG